MNKIKGDFKAAMSSAPAESFVTVSKVHPAGSLQARRLSNDAITFYWRFTHNGLTSRIPIGTWDPGIPPKALEPRGSRYSVRGAERAAERMALEHDDAIRAGLDGIRGKRITEAKQAEVAKLEKERSDAQTVEKLLLDYADHLKELGRAAHSDARSIFINHVITASPEIAKLRAVDLTGEHIADLQRRLLEMGHGRTGNKLRSYIHAAYQVAKNARGTARIPLRFKEYGIRTNPAADTVPDAASNKPDKAPLTSSELRKYFGALQKVGGIKGAALRLHFLTGGQRIAQLLRVKRSDVTDHLIRLIDIKGRPGKLPRENLIPITNQIREVLDLLPSPSPEETGVYLLSTDSGTTHIAQSTFIDWSREVASMVRIDRFTPKRIRSGIETLLASASVDKGIRGRLQSHGISGVQDVHYDGHDYLPVKRQTLEMLYRLMRDESEITGTNQVGLEERQSYR